MKVTIEVHRNEDNIELKTFSIHPSDSSHKSIGYMVGYVQALSDQGVIIKFVNKEDEIAPKPPQESAAPWEEFIDPDNMEQDPIKDIKKTCLN